MLLFGELLYDFETFLGLIGHTTNTNLNQIILVLGTYFFPIIAFSKTNCAICCGMRKPFKLKVRWYSALIIDINEYLDELPGF